MTSEFNLQVAQRLEQLADLLEQQGANPFRVGAYRRAAKTAAGLDLDLRELFEQEGLKGLEALPDIGSGIAAAIREMVLTGRWSKLDRLRGELDPVRLFQTVPGIGPALARTLHEELHVDTLEALELAAHDGRLEQVPGIGARRAALLRAALATMLASRLPRKRGVTDGPAIDELLAVDAEYLREAAAGRLPTIAPRRFNPEGRAWLPILHAQRGGWHFTALFSNTARAHELGMTGDWVVIYFYDDKDHHEGQHTVVTETRGPLTGQRVVRGRERECRDHYAAR